MCNKNIIFFAVALVFNQLTAQILNPIDFGFEETSITDWTQIAGFTEETTTVASGLKSMKADLTYPTSNPKLQTFRNSGTSNGYFELIAGNYELSVMVYLVGSVPSGLKIAPTTAPLIPVFTLDGVTKGQWVKLTMPFTVADTEAKTDNWLVIQFTGMPDSGQGIVYIDDIVIDREIVEAVPYSSNIKTLEEAYLNLDAGDYNLKLNVWVAPGTTISSFNTYLAQPFTMLKWDLTTIPKGEWVAINQDFVLEAAAVNSKFQIQVNNNPEYGGGIGTFYVDAITIVQNPLSIKDHLLKNIKIFPNPAHDVLNVMCPAQSKVTIYSLLGREVSSQSALENHLEIPVSHLAPGVYIMKVYFENKEAAKKIIIR